MGHTSVTTEVERRFKVKSDEWMAASTGVKALTQRVIMRGPEGGITRVRIQSREGKAPSAELTVKGPASSDGLESAEVNCEITVGKATALLDAFPGPRLVKDRYATPYAGRAWEVNVFHGENAGLVLAEIEFPSREAAEALRAEDVPPWIGEEVTNDPRYRSANLEIEPYEKWGPSAPPEEPIRVQPVWDLQTRERLQ